MTLGVEHHAVAVEDQFVIAADKIAVDQRNAVFGCDATEHVVAQLFLAEMVRRRGNIQEQARARFHQIHNRISLVVGDAAVILVVPNVLADRQAQLVPAEFGNRVGVGWLEITVLVEHVVRRQESLEAARDNPSAVNERGGIEVVLAGPLRVDVHVADEQGRVPDTARQLFERVQVVVDEAPFGEQIARWVTRDGHLGRDDERRPRPDSASVELENLGAVASQVANSGIDLGQCNLHY